MKPDEIKIGKSYSDGRSVRHVININSKKDDPRWVFFREFCEKRIFTANTTLESFAKWAESEVERRG